MAKRPKKKKKISVVLLFDLKSWHVQFWGLVLSNESAVLVWNVDLCILRVDKEKKETPTRLVWQAAAGVSRHVRAWRKTDVRGGSAWIGMYRGGLEPPANFPPTQVWDFLWQSRKEETPSETRVECFAHVELIVCPGWEMLLLRFHIRPDLSRWLCRRFCDASICPSLLTFAKFIWH